MSKRKGYKKIVVKGEQWDYKIKNSSIVAYSEKGEKRIAFANEVIGMDIYNYERDQHKRVISITPRQVAKWLETGLLETGRMKFPILENEHIRRLMIQFDAYLVGGYVRDCILGRASKDIDICSIKTPDKIELLLKKLGYKFRFHGKSYGVFIVHLTDDLSVELSAARRDFNHDGRHCEVEFVKSIEEDLARRDLTINALAVDACGKLIDPFGGRSDIHLRRISFVGNAEDRIEEDNLRAFRALRFSYQLGFDLPSETLKAINKYSHDIIVRSRDLSLSAERMREEIIKILSHYSYISDNHWNCFAQLLQSTGLPILATKGVMQPEKFHEFDVYEHTEKVLRFCPRPHLKLQLAALLHDLGKVDSLEFKEDGTPTFPRHEVLSAQIAKKWLTQLKFPKGVVSDVVDLVEKHMMEIGDTNKSKMKHIRRFSSLDTFKLWGLLRICDRLAKGDRLTIEKLVGEISIIKSCISLEEEQPLVLEVNGRDVMEILKIKPGKLVGEVLSSCRDLVFEDPNNNQREILLAHIEEVGKL